MKKKPYTLIIDSGLGGLHILAACRKLCPSSNFLYVADNKNLPYGNKTDKDIQEFVLNIYKRFSICYKITSIVLACNTATACAIDDLRNIIPVKIIGTEPNIKGPSKLQYKNIAILVTPLTSTSIRYSKLLSQNCCTIICDDLASRIEQACLCNQKLIIDDLIATLKKQKTDAIVLGCTHYNYIKKELSKLNLPIFDSIDGVAKQVRLYEKTSNCNLGNTIILTTSKNQKQQTYI